MFEQDIEGVEDLRRLNHWRSYQSTLSFILYTAIKKLYPKAKLRIEHSMSRGFYCLLNRRINQTDIKKIDKKMRQIIEMNLPINARVLQRSKAIKLFEKTALEDKVVLLKNIRIPQVTVYSLLDIYDIFLVPPFNTTGKASQFYLKKFAPGFVMVFPIWQDISRLPEYVPQPRLARIFSEHEEWAQILGVSDLGQLNYQIKKGTGSEIIKVSEALHEKKIVYIADQITKRNSRLVLIAGPSSAGKTTFTKRLAIQLLVNGIRPLSISTDDYFLPHSQTPKDKFGRLDFESINAVDIKLLNQHLHRILKGETVMIPRFNFITGRRNKGRSVYLEKNGVILLEGIHCLNDKLTHLIPASSKFKIYVSALTQLNIDDHNRISTTDTRMLRRIVRDTHYRGYRIQGVLRHWSSVRRGEEQNIYPFQEQADEMFNSALIYEPAVLKKFCLPILHRVKKSAPEYKEAKRLINFLNLFFELNDREVPSNSILREFIGGSSFIY
ncbi:hypothetical protein BXT86_04860 [candidate division WOR-3 bacterium 4484_100]|uniref:AAA+ ATPase domain-containing protein n=1 Tax=candidate division WOR-3 bacterium 4484_100 TaxID=1936077 RepID=A0A1V4QEI5_UNCW3|nr:MAG: hypothetical protein BXT86_04860 [candidate division WOR-3 bacterium 4484_100]